MSASTPSLYVIDASGFVFRAYHAIREPLTTSSGLPTKAVYGFTNMLLKLRREKSPTHMAVVLDADGESFRYQIYSEYKANRKEMPEDLAPQWPYVSRVAQALGYRSIEVPGVEADDVIATLVRQARKKSLDVVVVSSDKDLMQLVGPGVRLYDTMSERWYGPEEVREKWGVGPEQLGDLLALCGDSSDNIPGVPGVGPKTAASLLEKFGSLEEVLSAGDKIERPKIREAIATYAKEARLARRLVTLREDLDLDLDVNELRPAPMERAAAEALFKELEFGRLLAELGSAPTVSRERYQTILTTADLDDVAVRLDLAKTIAVDTETTSLDAVRAQLVGISLSWGEGQACYIPVGHTYLGAPKQLSRDEVLKKLRPFLEDPARKKYGQNHKYDLVVLLRHGVDLRGVLCDPMIASYLLDPSRPSHGLDALAREQLGHQMITYEDVTGRGRHQVGFEEVGLEKATAYSAEDADVTWRLAEKLLPRVVSEGMSSLLEDVEIPLARVLALMELRGIKLDVDRLRSLAVEAGKKLHALETEAHAMAGHPVNLNSPVQLRELLFEKLGLPVIRRTKTGPSTDADVLEELAPQHPIVAKILEWRTIAKLKSTYIDALPQAVNPATGRLHTSYNQAVAATGRLSASEPNVQNIPVRTELGREVRRAFVADAGHVLLSCDYSQVELRVLAHLSEDPVLVDTFKRDQDVHARTAAEVFGVELDKVTPEMRRIAKSVVYGLAYGQTDFGLSRSLGIPKTDAHRYIESFFSRYAKLATYLESLVERVRQGEPARTVLGRRRFVPDIASSNRAQRGYAERIAKNTPIQGTAADILKLAMIRVQALLEAEFPKTHMLLTVHDELVFETPADGWKVVADRVREIMEQVMELRIPLKVDVGSGPTWADAH